MSGGDWKEMFAAACRGDVELVRAYVEAGVDVDYSHPDFQETALVAAILARHERVVQLLPDHGADPNLMSAADELTPLLAAQQARLPAIEERLRSLGATPPPTRTRSGGRRTTRGPRSWAGARSLASRVRGRPG